MKKHLLLLLSLVLLGSSAFSQSFTVSGQYLDKKNNPVADATVTYYDSQGVDLGSAQTLGNGNFTLDVTFTGINSIKSSKDPFVQLPTPNPFQGKTRFTVEVSDASFVMITHANGSFIDKIDLPGPGVYHCTWGGMNIHGIKQPAGTYNIAVVHPEHLYSRKVVFLGDAQQSLRAQQLNTGESNAYKLLSQDRINFTKENTTGVDVYVYPIHSDTNIGTISTNIGPELINPIEAVVSIDNTNSWNLNDYCYNDDQSIYSFSNSNFTLSDDSILTFTGDEAGVFQFTITATDAFNASFTAEIPLDIEVTEESLVIVSGTYIDKKNNPIASANVEYFELGINSVAQTTTNASGNFSLQIPPGKSTLSSDKIEIQKMQTSDFELWVYTPDGDTSLGDLQGNVGPENTAPLVLSVHIDDWVNINLNEYFYNDEQSIYTLSDNDNFSILQDSLLSFTGNTAGFYQPTITATDEEDNSLTATMQAQITITNEQTIMVSGNYEDAAGNPIADAEVNYQEEGDLLGQTTTDSNGDFALNVTVNPGLNASLTMVKPQTSTIGKMFNSPTQDTIIDMVGNVGPEALADINETNYTLYAPFSWNLDDYFYNDDLSYYTESSPDFTIENDHFLNHNGEEGVFNTSVMATDGFNADLTDQISVDFTVEYSMMIPDFDIDEDTDQTVLIADLNSYKNPGISESLNYTILSQSNATLIDLSIAGDAIEIIALQENGFGSSTIEIEYSNGSETSTTSFIVNVIPMPDISGQLTDIFDGSPIDGATVSMTLDSITFYTTTTDANGNYNLQIPEESNLSYYSVYIEKAGYTPFHTWATVEAGTGDVSEDYTIIPSSFVWDLYNAGFRVTTGGSFPTSMRVTTHHWLTPPPMHTYSDNALVGGADITVQYANLIYNINNILPTFNPRDAIPANLVEHTSFGYQLQDGDMGAYFDNAIPGNGVVTLVYDGPKINKCSTAYKDYVGVSGADISTFNQELGTCFGAITEPPVSSNYDSVFTDPAGSNTYTSDDFDCSTVMLDRARVHYKNLTASGDDAYDWEMRPDEVLTWYPGTGKQVYGPMLEYKVIGFEGEIIEQGLYRLSDVPSRVMKMAKIMFTPEQIAQKENQEKNPVYKFKKWVKKSFTKNETHNSLLSKKEIRQFKREQRRAERREKREGRI
jgi:hypothetical protein